MGQRTDEAKLAWLALALFVAPALTVAAPSLSRGATTDGGGIVITGGPTCSETPRYDGKIAQPQRPTMPAGPPEGLNGGHR